MKKYMSYRLNRGKRNIGRIFSFMLPVFLLSLFSMPSAAKSSNTNIINYKEKEAVKLTVNSNAANIEEVDSSFASAFNVTANSATRTKDNISFRTTFDYKSSNQNLSFLFGYYNENDFHPFEVYYNVINENGVKEKRSCELPNLSNNGNDYYGAGILFGNPSLIVNLALDVDENEELDLSSITFTNIYKAVKNDSGVIVPDYNFEYYFTPVGKFEKAKIQKDSDLITLKFHNISTFNSFCAFEFNYSINALESYKELKGSVYSKNEKEINEGTKAMKYAFESVNNSLLVLNYNNGKSVKKSFSGRSANIVLNGDGGILRLLVEDVDLNGLVSIELQEMSFGVNIISVKNSVRVNRSDISKVFSSIRFYGEDFKYDGNNITLQLALSSLIFVGVYIASAVAVFLYQKNKYKNDEFKRVKPKLFVKTALSGFVALFSIFEFAIFVIFRSTSLFNSATVFNPCDIPICVFAVISILMIGYFVKFFITRIKNHLEANKAKKLHINQDDKYADDGTK